MTSSLPAHLIDLAPGRPHPVSVSYQGLLYSGEVIFAEEWDPQWGAVLRGNQLFRIVFLDTHQEVPTQELQDSRIAVCLPSHGSGRREQERRRERRVLREVRARYAVPATDTALLEQERQSYASGVVVTRTGVEVQPHAFFEAPLPSDWVSTLGESLLAWTYPQLPIDGTRFPRPLSEEEARLLFRGLVQEATDPEVAAAVETFGPGLSLTVNGSSTVLASGDCLTFQLLRHELAERGGTLPCVSLYERLAHVHGLPHPLVTLYVLAFLRTGQPTPELHLTPGHSLRTVTGERYAGQVVLPETVASLEFVPSLEGEATMLRYPAPVSWNTLALYFNPLDASLRPLEEPVPQDQLPRLMAALADLRQEVQDTSDALGQMARDMGGALPQEAEDLLQWLGTLAEARAPDMALRTAQRLFASPAGLEQGVEEYRHLVRLASMKESLLSGATYLEETYVPDGFPDLALKRQQLSALHDLGELASSVPTMATVDMLSASFLDDYHATYVRHHDAYHREIASLLAQLQDVRIEGQALARLNGIRDLGEPLEEKASERWHELSQALAVCPVPSGEVPVAQTALCPSCGVRLGQAPQSSEVEEVTRAIRGGLREQNARLDLPVVHRILDHRQDERIDRFIKLVQASDLSGPASMLDGRVEAFVRDLLVRQ